MTFTDMNTEGFTESDLATMNAALRALEAEGVDPDHAADILNNAFQPDITLNELLTDARKRMAS